VARLDKLIQLLHEQRADALRLSAGEPAALQQNGTARPLTREALTDAQITALVREIAPPAVAPQVGTGATLAFGYASPSGAVEAELSSSPAGLLVLVRRSGGGAPARRPLSGGDEQGKG
jgi:hypothetical protein